MGIGELLEGIFGSGSERRARTPRMPEQPLPEEDGGMAGVMRGVVQIVALKRGIVGGLSSAWTGSGTIVHPAGVILTNCHVANPRAMGMSSPAADKLGISITLRSDTAPALSYFAEVVAQSPELDLAVVRIVSDTRGRRVDDLDLPHVPLGDSDRLQLGDRLSILGYPGIGGETVTFTAGNVAGFSRQRGVSHPRAWIKTDATIAGGNSGGTAIDRDGRLVGIPTQAAAGSGVTPVDARPVLDTNRDGRIDQRDSPIAVGGFINGLRPVNLAVPLLEHAGMQIDRDRGGPTRQSAPRRETRRYEPAIPEEAPSFSELLFATGVTDDGRPINPTDQIPEGRDTVYATFAYSGMRRGLAWSAVWMQNEQIIIEQKKEWDDDSFGRKAIKISNRSGVPSGEYHLVLGIGTQVALEGKMIVGTPVDHTDAEVRGRVIDDRTGRGVDGAVVIVIKPGVDVRDFLERDDRSMTLTVTKADRDGEFVFPEQIPKGRAYGLVAAARGYRIWAVEGALRLSTAAPEHAHIGEISLDPQ